jgi:hypothetical protein
MGACSEGASESASGGRRAVRMCVRCQVVTDRPVVISEVHQNSGPGFTVYTCPDCAPCFPYVPDALTPLPAGRQAGGER